MSSAEPTLPKCACPYCGHELDAATAVTEEGAAPSPGDFSVCAYCGLVLVFRADLKVRWATAVEAAEMRRLLDEHRERINAKV